MTGLATVNRSAKVARLGIGPLDRRRSVVG